jgi:O-antigen ligase
MQIHNVINRASLKNFHPQHLALGIIAFLPVIFTLITWDNDGYEEASAFAMRYLSIPVIVGEVLVILLAMHRGFEIRYVFRGMQSVAKYLLAAWALLAIAALASAGDQLPLSAFTTIRYMLHGFFFASLMALLNQSPRSDSERWLTIFVFGGFAYVGTLALFALMIPDKDTFPWVIRMPSGTNIRQIGYYAALMGVAPMAMLLFGKRWILPCAFAFAMVVMFVSWTGSRGALFGLTIGTVVAIMAVRQKPNLRRSVLTFACFLAGMGASIPLPTPTPEFGLIRMVKSAGAPDISSGRTVVWESTLREIIESPVIGHGSGTFNQNMKSKYGFDFNHPHQLMLQYAYDWGVIGAVVVLILLAMLSYAIWRRANVRNDAAGFASIASCLVVLSIASIDGALFYPLSIVIALGMIAIGLVFPTDANDAAAGVTRRV